MVQLHKNQHELHKKGGKHAFNLHFNSFFGLFFMSSQTLVCLQKHPYVCPSGFAVFICVFYDDGTLLGLSTVTFE